MALAQCLGPCRVARGDRGDDIGVFLMPAVDCLKRIAGGVEPRILRIPDGQSHQDVDKKLQHRVFRLFGQCCVELIARRLGAQHSTQPVDAGFVDLLCGKRCRQRLQQQPRIQQITDRGAQVLQIDDDGVSRRGGVGLADEQSAVGPATHARDLMVLDEPNGFHSKPPWQRIAILLAGPAANFVVAMLLITAYGLTQLNTDPGKVVRVFAGAPAAVAGVQVGDEIRSVNGKPVTGPGYIQQEEHDNPGKPIVLSGVHADGKPFTYTLQPVCDATGKNCRVGIAVAGIVTVQSAVTNGVRFPFDAIGGIASGIGALATGQIKGGLLGPDGLTGPIGIATITYQQVNQGWLNYIGLVAILSVALGFTNLLPVPALDGGRIVVALVEWVRRRPFDRKSELNFQRWGLVALLALAALISFLDIQRIATGTFPGSH